MLASNSHSEHSLLALNFQSLWALLKSCQLRKAGNVKIAFQSASWFSVCVLSSTISIFVNSSLCLEFELRHTLHNLVGMRRETCEKYASIGVVLSSPHLPEMFSSRSVFLWRSLLDCKATTTKAVRFNGKFRSKRRNTRVLGRLFKIIFWSNNKIKDVQTVC